MRTEMCVFDAYGTLFDFNSAVARHRAAIGPKADALADLWRNKQIQYTWLRNSMGVYDKFWQVTGEALDHCLAAHGISDAGVHDKLMRAYLALDPFPEVPGHARQAEARRQAARHPVERQSRDARPHGEGVAAGRPLRGRAERRRCQVFKPDQRVYRLVEQRCGVKPDKVCFLSSNCWDAHGAAHFGFATVWVNRARAPDDNLPGTTVATIDDLSHLPSLLGVPDVRVPHLRRCSSRRPPPRRASPSARRCWRTRASTRGWAAASSSRPSACSAPARSSCAAPTISSPR
jgi:2-haloacid dehalogenase